MSSRWLIGLVSIAALSAGPGVDIDPINLIVGPPFEVPSGPVFVAVADFNGDGLDDAAISNPEGRYRGVLLSDGVGGFDSFVPVSDSLPTGAISVGDLNADGRADLVTLVADPPGVVVDTGTDGGAFGATTIVPLPFAPLDLTTADLDADGRAEVIVTDVGGYIQILRNAAFPGLALSVIQSVEVGEELGEVNAAHLNGDGRLDLLVLERRSGRLILLLRTENSEFAPETVTIPAGSLAIAASDFNNDSATDIAILSENEEGQSVTVLINVPTDLQAGAVVFETRSIPIPCPGAFNGMPIVCAVRDLVAGDFQADGFADLAVAISTAFEADPNVQTPALLQAFAGFGDGSFVFSARVNIGYGPNRTATGDFAGDLFTDIVVTEMEGGGGDVGSTPRSVVQVVNGFSERLPRPEGGCREDRQCESGACVDGQCCTSPSCAEGERCDIPGFEGTCHIVADLGHLCSEGGQCASGLCVQGFCCASPSCPAGEFCNAGICGAPVAVAAPCTLNEQCELGFCVDGFCCEAALCPSGWRCDIPDYEGSCRQRQPQGSMCTSYQQCESSLFCTDGVCCPSDDCGAGQTCNRADSPGTCAPIADVCDRDSDCETGNCDLSRPNPPSLGECGPARTPTACAPSCFGPCQSDTQCQPEFFCNVEEGHICCDHHECPEGMSCRIPGREGFCYPLPTPTPTKLPNGRPCVGDVCHSGFCVDDVCCQQAECERPNRCDVLGSEGHCAPPAPVCEPCLTDLDCAPTLRCVADADGCKRCTLVPPSPTVPPTRDADDDELGSISDDGCQLSSRASRSQMVWVLLAAGLAFAAASRR